MFEEGVVIVGVPAEPTNDHKPLALPGLLPSKVVKSEQTVWLEAFASTALFVTSATVLSVQVPKFIVHLNWLRPGIKFITFVSNAVTLTIFPGAVTFVHVPIPWKG